MSAAPAGLPPLDVSAAATLQQAQDDGGRTLLEVDEAADLATAGGTGNGSAGTPPTRGHCPSVRAAPGTRGDPAAAMSDAFGLPPGGAAGVPSAGRALQRAAADGGRRARPAPGDPVPADSATVRAWLAGHLPTGEG